MFWLPHALAAETITLVMATTRQKSLLQFQLTSRSISPPLSPHPLHICLRAVLENWALGAIAKWTVARNNNNTGKHKHAHTHKHVHDYAHTFRLLSWFIVVAIWQPYYFPVACRSPPSLSSSSTLFSLSRLLVSALSLQSVAVDRKEFSGHIFGLSRAMHVCVGVD